MNTGRGALRSKSRQIEMVDFHDVMDSFVEADIEGLEEEFDEFLEEQARAGKSRPVLYVDDEFYDDVSAEGTDVGAVNDDMPVRILPKEDDLFEMLSRFSFDEGVKDVLEGGRSMLVNPGGGTNFEGTAYLRVGEDFAQEAYEKAVSSRDPRDYLEGQRGVGVMDLPGGGLEVQVNEQRLGREFDYSEGDSLALRLGDEVVQFNYENVESAEVGERYKFVMH